MYLENFFFDCSDGHETKDEDLLFLADTMSATDGLDVQMRVEIRVEYDDGVGGSQVDAKTSRSRRQ